MPSSQCLPSSKIEGVLDDELAARLEDAGVGYSDAAGRRWLPGQPRTARARETRLSGKRSLRPESLRLAQLLADHPDELWTGRVLAARGQTTYVTAQSLLKRLEGEGLVDRRGKGRATVRRISDAARLRSWLARNGRPRRVRRLSCFVPEPTDVATEVDGHVLVLTGAAAAAQMEMPVLTRVPRSIFRVEVPPDALDDVPAMLGGFRTERGANVILIADPDRLGVSDARKGSGGKLRASPSRVMLDLFLESRGEAAVGVFLGLWGSRVL